MADARQAARLAWLKKNRPNDPQIKVLQKALGGSTPSTGGPATTENKPADMGSIESFLGGIFDNFKMPDYSGAPKILTAGDLEAQRAAEEDLIYKKETQYNDRNRLRDLEETKQELANRGISYNPAAANDPNTSNLYGKTVGSVEEKYSAADQSARDAARLGSTNLMANKAAVNKTAYDSFIDTATKSFTSQLDAANAGNSVLNTLMSKYGLDKQEAQSILDRKSQERIAKMQIDASNRRSGGGGGGSSEGGGFQIID